MAKSERLLDAIQVLAVYRKEGEMVSHSNINSPPTEAGVCEAAGVSGEGCGLPAPARRSQAGGKTESSGIVTRAEPCHRWTRRPPQGVEVLIGLGQDAPLAWSRYRGDDIVDGDSRANRRDAGNQSKS